MGLSTSKEGKPTGVKLCTTAREGDEIVFQSRAVLRRLSFLCLGDIFGVRASCSACACSHVLRGAIFLIFQRLRGLGTGPFRARGGTNTVAHSGEVTAGLHRSSELVSYTQTGILCHEWRRRMALVRAQRKVLSCLEIDAGARSSKSLSACILVYMPLVVRGPHACMVAVECAKRFRVELHRQFEKVKLLEHDNFQLVEFPR